MDVVFIGAGNVATNLSNAFNKKGIRVRQIISKHASSASLLARQFHCPFSQLIDDIDENADLYVISVTDSSIETVVGQMPILKGLVLHTSGSTYIDVLKAKFEKCGVFYPLQSFSKFRKVDFSDVPVFIEGNSEGATNLIENLAKEISLKVFNVTSEQRMALHVSGVFANNFTNHMYALAYEICKTNELPFDVFFPLIQETADKIQVRSPRASQTGPAARYDMNIVQKHIDFLSKDSELMELYDKLTQSIIKFSQ